MKTSFLNLPPWLLAMCLIASIAVISLLYFSDATIECGKRDTLYSCGFTKPMKYDEKEFIGYFLTLDAKGKETCLEETIKMRFFNDNKTVEGHAEGNVHDHNGSLVKRTWTYRGFRHGNDIALAYVTEDRLPTGNGIYYLLSRGGDYSGYWMGIDFPTDVRVQCPYVLSTTKKRGSETCDQVWPDVFKQGCRVLTK